MKFISDTKWLSLITETYLEGLDTHTSSSAFCVKVVDLIMGFVEEGRLGLPQASLCGGGRWW
jgi:hypothetical protein